MDPETGKEVYVPMSDMLPMVHPDDFVIGGWDISGVEMDKAMGRAKVLEWDLQRQVGEYMKGVKPMPSIYCRFDSATSAVLDRGASKPAPDRFRLRAVDRARVCYNRASSCRTDMWCC